MRRLRPITDADQAAVLALNETNVALLAPMDDADLTRLRSHAARADVLDVDGVVAGFVITFGPGSGYDGLNFGWFRDRYGEVGVYYLDRVVVADTHRRQGLAGFVYDELEAEAAATSGRMCLEVNVEPPNEPSLAFHAARGYAEVGRRASHGHTVALMIKEFA